ncbi:hypothetical protein [Novosphingobium sp.]|uniref:hypothetical protein n=1 Tax=Novosphingobium sp. TaxID=1874826 RepID=UPI00262C1B51|nr:hypothetical protein [Novosphingobium sp.]
MTAAMDFRGPDGFHHHVGADFALGHCAFHTTPGSAEAPQPLFSEDRKFAVVMDGWLANPDELRAELESRKARVRGPSDAELVLQAYAEWGDDCANHLEGEYAVVIYDAYRRRAFCLRDHMGMRPLFYHWNGRRAGGGRFSADPERLSHGREPCERVLRAGSDSVDRRDAAAVDHGHDRRCDRAKDAAVLVSPARSVDPLPARGGLFRALSRNADGQCPAGIAVMRAYWV